MKHRLKTALAAAYAIFALGGAALAQSAPLHFLSAATTNCTLVQTGKVVMHDLIPVNTTATIYYLKLFNKATPPVAGTDVPSWTIPIPENAAGAGLPIPSTLGLTFDAGLGFCLTGAIADNDTTVAAPGVAINFGISGN
jgi:hypothetical protein